MTKIIVHIDGMLLDVYLPASGTGTRGGGGATQVLALIEYTRTLCRPPCPRGQTCRIVRVNGVFKARCVRP